MYKKSKHKRMGIKAALAVSAVSLAVGMTATADTIISVNFDGDGRGVLSASDLAGAPGVRVANWNTITNGATSPYALTYEDGTAATGVGVDINGANFGNRAPVPGGAEGDQKLFDGIKDQNQGTWSIDVTGLGFAEYDVYVYRRSENAGRAGKFTIGSTTYYAQTLDGGTSSNPTDENGYVLSTDTTYDGPVANAGGAVAAQVDKGNYVKFSGLTGSSFTLDLSAVSDDGAPRNKVAGFQIVAVPEPGTLGLIAAFGGGLLFFRRRFMM